MKKITERVKYKGNGLKINDDSLPTLRHTSREFIVKEAYIKEVGIVDIGGEVRHYHDVRVFMKETEIGR